MFARFKVFLTKKITQIWQFSNYYHCFLLNRKLNFGKKLFLLLTAFIFDDYWKMKQVPVLLSNGEEKISEGSSTQVLVLEKYLGFYHTTYLVITLSGACKTFEKSWKKARILQERKKNPFNSWNQVLSKIQFQVHDLPLQKMRDKIPNKKSSSIASYSLLL